MDNTTCSEPHHRRRGVPVVYVSRPQLPIASVAPAVDAATRQQGARVVLSHSDRNSACGETRKRRDAAERAIYIYI